MAEVLSRSLTMGNGARLEGMRLGSDAAGDDVAAGRDNAVPDPPR